MLRKCLRLFTLIADQRVTHLPLQYRTKGLVIPLLTTFKTPSERDPHPRAQISCSKKKGNISISIFLCTKTQTIRRAFRQVADAHDGTMVNAVIAWELMHPSPAAAIIGVRSQNEVREMIGGANWKLTRDEMSAVDALAAWEGSKVSAG
ncbi:hypothetical protein E6H34_05230 [Candidatus Bathyarchaeota archaeon]|nr:MAG: hypothetical protein E6H34_05230 [Candidatus Bathyarchaeota archaeon]